MFIINRIVFALNGLAILALLLSYAAPFVSPELYWPIAFLGLGYPVLVILNCVCILYWIAVFKLKFLYSLIVIILGYTFLPSYIQFGAKKSTDKTNSLSVVSFNSKYFGAYENKRIQQPDRFFEMLDKLNPDVLCFQEFHNYHTSIEKNMFKRLFKRMKGYYAYNLETDEMGTLNGKGIVIFSRYPIVDSGVVEHQEETSNFTIFTDIVTHGDTVRIINTHLQSIKFEAPQYDAVKKLDLTNDSVVTQYSTITKKLKRAFVKRAKQAEAVRDFIDGSPHKIILTGDFNDSPTSYAFRTVKGKMKDAFVESGAGFGRTYVGTMPSFRIDYILYDASYTSSDYYAKAFEFSDHKILSCRVKLK
ncbi:MAG: endonuclease/exonuclease/phosphatase family protein [Bacteroidota bacterium]